jgi:hypothetical protein
MGEISLAVDIVSEEVYLRDSKDAFVEVDVKAIGSEDGEKQCRWFRCLEWPLLKIRKSLRWKQ